MVCAARSIYQGALHWTYPFVFLYDSTISNFVWSYSMKCKTVWMNVLPILLGLFCSLFAASCTSEKPQTTLKMIFYPNESSESMKDARAAFQEILAAATGKNVEIITTTDYNIALEALASGKADLAYVGAEGYLRVHERNKAVVPLVTNSGPSGTLSDAKYYSLIIVQKDKADSFRNPETGSFDLKKLKGKKISFVATGSTSGFVIPAKFLAAQFGLSSSDDLVLTDSVFSKVLFAGSHQGSQVNLFRGDADAAVCAIPQTIGVYDILEGEPYQTGTSYRVREGSDEPFGNFAGSEMTIIQSIPVLNAPIVANTDTVSAEDIEKITAALASDKTAQHPGIFNSPESEKRGIYPKYSEKTRLVETSDAWYDEIRRLTK